jgi:hypothetical protein
MRALLTTLPAAIGVLVIVVASGCSVGGPSTVSLNSASVDTSYTCPAGADNAPYEVHATIDLRNGTSSSLAIKSVAVSMTLAAVKGSWLERVGDKYDASGVTFAPATVDAGKSTSLKVTIPSACTNGPAPTGSYGEYSVGLVVTASSGTYTIASQNRHRILAG